MLSSVSLSICSDDNPNEEETNVHDARLSFFLLSFLSSHIFSFRRLPPLFYPLLLKQTKSLPASCPFHNERPHTMTLSPTYLIILYIKHYNSPRPAPPALPTNPSTRSRTFTLAAAHHGPMRSPTHPHTGLTTATHASTCACECSA